MTAFALRQDEFSSRLDGTKDQFDSIYWLTSSLNTFRLHTYPDTYIDLEVQLSQRRQQRIKERASRRSRRDPGGLSGSYLVSPSPFFHFVLFLH